jgi:hypothetical protein
MRRLSFSCRCKHSVPHLIRDSCIQWTTSQTNFEFDILDICQNPINLLRCTCSNSSCLSHILRRHTTLASQGYTRKAIRIKVIDTSLPQIYIPCYGIPHGELTLPDLHLLWRGSVLDQTLILFKFDTTCPKKRFQGSSSYNYDGLRFPAIWVMIECLYMRMPLEGLCSWYSNRAVI